MLVALAVTGSTPTHTSVGKVSRLPPPAMEFTNPPATAATRTTPCFQGATAARTAASMTAQFRRFPYGGNAFSNAPMLTGGVRRGVEVEIRYSLRLPRDVVTVPLVRTICRDAMHRLGVTTDCQGDVALALTEACANVVQHAGGESEYEVAIAFIDETCHIRVVDRGHGIDLTDSNRTEMVLEEDSGRGIVLMRLLVDRIAFESRPEDGPSSTCRNGSNCRTAPLLAAL